MSPSFRARLTIRFTPTFVRPGKHDKCRSIYNKIKYLKVIKSHRLLNETQSSFLPWQASLHIEYIEKYALSFDNFYYWRSAIYQKWTNLNMTHAWLFYWKEESIWMNNKAKQIINYYIFISCNNFLASMSAELLIILL